jgi:hypothetical protein
MEQRGPTLLLMVLKLIAAAELVVTVVNPAGFSKQRRKSSRRMAPKATLFDFLGCGSFHKRPLP